MILLGINCGLGNSDCGQLRFRNIDLIGGWLNYPRPKTSVARRCQTLAGNRDGVEGRRSTIDPNQRKNEHRELVFMTRIGQPWSKDTPDSPITKEFSKGAGGLETETARPWDSTPCVIRRRQWVAAPATKWP